MRKVAISETVLDKVSELRAFLTDELKLSRKAAHSRTARIDAFLVSLAGAANYPLCRFKKWHRLGYRCAVFEKDWVFAYEVFDEGGRLRFLGIGGAKLDGDAEKFLLEAKVPYAIGYGLTETAPLLAGAAPSQVRLGSTGPQAPGVELRLENINPDTRQGEIVAHSPSVMLGYFKNPEATKEVFTADGWFRTGDLGEFDKDGWLYIKGRLKNMIVGPGGENIYPEDIETVLNSHVYIADSIVTEQQGRLVALVHFNRDEIESMIDDWREEWTSKKEALEAKTEQLKKEILDFVNAKVNRFTRISEVVEEKDDFVKTPTHKIKRFLYSKKKESGTPGEHPAGRPETK